MNEPQEIQLTRVSLPGSSGRQVVSAGIGRRFTKAVSSPLQYSFFQYSEPSTGGINNFTGHGVFGTLNVTWF